MKTPMLVPAILAAVMLSTPVLAAGSYGSTAQPAHIQKAATMTPAEKCTALQKQFDDSIKMHETASKAADAKTMRSEADKLCSNGKPIEGIAKLEQALKDLGVKPKA